MSGKIASKKVLLVFGTRPEAIKMAPLVESLSKNFKVMICVTAQHRGMLDQVLEIFNLKPDFDLDLMKSNQDLFSLTSAILLSLKPIYEQSKPDIILVHGDTTTAFAAALCAFYSKIPIGHIEAGLRTHDISSPFPEEANRQLVTRLTTYHFAPTLNSERNLIKEGVESHKIFVTGNTVIDAILSVKDKANTADYPKALLHELPFLENNTQLGNIKIILVTGHRRENFGKGFAEICKALEMLALSNPLLHIVYPVHLNPNVKQPVTHMLSHVKNIHLIDPLSYVTFVKLMQDSYIILTDSGGIQEEAPSLGKPVLVMRENSERPEAITAGTALLVGSNAQEIFSRTQEILDSEEMYLKMSKAHNPYGDGQASEIIATKLSKVLL
jgi:UDP-N-acetylglucosamine 2-epimerase (non-hydrolysing)